MPAPAPAKALRIYIGAHLSRGSQIPIFESLLHRARIMKLAGASVFRCQKGFGAAELKGSSDYKMSADDPVIIEIVDTPEKILEFIPVAKELLRNRGLMTTHDVEIVHQGGLAGMEDV